MFDDRIDDDGEFIRLFFSAARKIGQKWVETNVREALMCARRL